MRSRLRALLLGFLFGPVPMAGEPVEVDGLEAEAAPAARRSSGYVAQGSGFYVWDEDSREAADWAVALGAGGESRELAAWRVVASRWAAQSLLPHPGQAGALVRALEAAEDDRAVSPLGAVLCLLPSLERTALVCEWAGSASEPVRHALARALAAPFEAVGVASALEQLERDPSASVRRLARAATARRRGSGIAHERSPL